MPDLTSTTPSTPTQKGPIHVSDTIPPTTLLEPSFTDAIRLIEEAADVADHQRQHWPCSLRRIADGLERPPELIPARWTSIRVQVAKLHHARVGMSPKTLANHKANVSGQPCAGSVGRRACRREERRLTSAGQHYET